jgi:nicotinate-nucleotide--dimethylbenzimidazole phosphoribosyltransferase
MEDRFDPSMGEIRALIEALPPWSESVQDRVAAERDASLGLIDTLSDWVAAGQGRTTARLDRPRTAVFFGNWGEADGGTGHMTLDAIRSGRSRLNALCRAQDAELRVYEMAFDAPAATGSEPGLSQKECATAMAYGMMAVEDGIDLLCVAAAGPGLASAAGKLAAALGDVPEPLSVLARHGDHALSALAGALVAARMARVPVILDGAAALAAGAVLQRINGDALDHCVLAQQLDGPARALQETLGKAAVLDLGETAEDGRAALLVLGLLRSAVASRDIPA